MPSVRLVITYQQGLMQCIMGPYADQHPGKGGTLLVAYGWVTYMHGSEAAYIYWG